MIGASSSMRHTQTVIYAAHTNCAVRRHLCGTHKLRHTQTVQYHLKGMAKSCNKHHRATHTTMQHTLSCTERARRKDRIQERQREREKEKTHTVRLAESRWRLDKRMPSFRVATWRLPLSVVACSCISRRSATIVSCVAASRCSSRVLSSSSIEPCSVWQRVAACCSVVRCGAVCWQCVGGVLAVCCNVLQCVAARMSCPRLPTSPAVSCRALQCAATCSRQYQLVHYSSPVLSASANEARCSWREGDSAHSSKCSAHQHVTCSARSWRRCRDSLTYCNTLHHTAM